MTKTVIKSVMTTGVLKLLREYVTSLTMSVTIKTFAGIHNVIEQSKFSLKICPLCRR